MKKFKLSFLAGTALILGLVAQIGMASIYDSQVKSQCLNSCPNAAQKCVSITTQCIKSLGLNKDKVKRCVEKAFNSQRVQCTKPGITSIVPHSGTGTINHSKAQIQQFMKDLMSEINKTCRMHPNADFCKKSSSAR